MSAVSVALTETPREHRSRPVQALWLSLVVLVPLFFAIHGVLWHRAQINSALLIYLVKIAGLVYLGTFFIRFHPRVLLRRSAATILIASVLILASGLLAPLGYLGETSPFYYAADLLGTLTTVLYILVTYFLLERRIATTEQIYGVVEMSTLVIAVGVLVNSAITGGEKVSIPSEIHFGIAVTIIRWITHQGRHSTGDNLRIAIVLVATVASAFRMNYLIALISIVVGYAWVLARRRTIRSIARMAAVLVLVAAVGFVFRDRIQDRFGSIALSDQVDLASGEVFTDASAGQRFLEGLLVVQEMSENREAIVFGKGFGATYENFWNLIPHYSTRMHHVHNSVLTILLRNGLVGVVAVFIIPFFLAWDLLRGDRELFVAAHGLMMTYLALMTDQYLYWGLLYGLSVALWWHARRRMTDRQLRRE